MPAGTLDLEIEQGATFTKVLTWKDSEDVPINLSGFQARMQIRTTEEAADPPALALTTVNGRIALGGIAGTITLLISATDTSAITAGSYVYDLELESGGGTVTRLVKGAVTVDREITR